MSKSDKLKNEQIESLVNDSVVAEEPVVAVPEVPAFSNEYSKHADSLDKFNKKHNARCFSERVDIFKYYLLDRESYKLDRECLVRRGIIVLNSWNEWLDLISKNEKLLFNFKCVKGVELKSRYKKFYDSLAIAAVERNQKAK